MIHLILTLAIVGLLVWLIVTYIPMPEVFKKAIIIISIICVILYLINIFGFVDLPVPHIR